MAASEVMISYSAKQESNLIEALETMEIEGAHYALLRLRKDAPADCIYSLLAPLKDQAVIASDMVAKTGEHSVLCKMQCSEGTLLEALSQKGENFIQDSEKSKTFNPWFWRGATSIVGQTLQIASSFTTYKPENVGLDGRPTMNPDGAIFGFAALNLMANVCNMTFGSQHKPDPHQLRYLKEQFNLQWQPYAIDTKELPSVDAKAVLRRAPEHQALPEKIHSFLREQSVTFGELGLRILGTTSLIAPINRWPVAFEYLMEGNVAKAGQSVLNPEKSTLAVGITTMAGKISALLAKEEDPYNPKPKTAIDHFREKVAFKLSSVIEGSAATYMMWDRYHNKRSIVGYDGEMNDPAFKAQPGETLKQVRERPESYMNQLKPDVAGVAGNLAFVNGYVMRYFANVGSLDVDMKELSAHISDGLATLPKEMIPDALAATAMGLKLHFHDKKEITASGIYNDIAQDLKHQHIIDVGAIRLNNARVDGMNSVENSDTAHTEAAIPNSDSVINPSYLKTLSPKEQHKLV